VGVERGEAEVIYDEGREVVVKVLVELSAQNGRLAEQVERLFDRVAYQDERIAELERRLKRNSRNSWAPPSQDPPGAPGRKAGVPVGARAGRPAGTSGWWAGVAAGGGGRPGGGALARALRLRACVL
jgi:hypothetical protein